MRLNQTWRWRHSVEDSSLRLTAEALRHGDTGCSVEEASRGEREMGHRFGSGQWSYSRMRNQRPGVEQNFFRGNREDKPQYLTYANCTMCSECACSVSFHSSEGKARCRSLFENIWKYQVHPWLVVGSKITSCSFQRKNWDADNLLFLPPHTFIWSPGISLAIIVVVNIFWVVLFYSLVLF